MPAISEVVSMCKNGRMQEAYDAATAELAKYPNNVWAQREVGWALYYMMKEDSDKGDFTKLINHLDEIQTLDLLNVNDDKMILENLQLSVGGYVANNLSHEDFNSFPKLSALFQRIRKYQYGPSGAHSRLLDAFRKFENWPEMVDFIEWWDLEKLTQEDFTPYKLPNGKSIMSKAESAYIAMCKALLKLNDISKIELFLPKMEWLMKNHTEMTFPGYCYGKLLLKMGNNEEEARKGLVTFIRKKTTEYWAWLLLSETFSHDKEKQLACLLRAVHCKTKEDYIKNVRIKLTQYYINENQLARARFHIDAMTRFYLSKGWHLPYEMECWTHQPWLTSVQPDGSDPISYYGDITDEILCDGTSEALAIVTYIDVNTQRASLIYGQEMRMSQKLRFKVQMGDVLKINYLDGSNGHPKIIHSVKVHLPDNLSYAKYIDGTVTKPEGKTFAFFKSGEIRAFISPDVVQKNNLINHEKVKSLIVCDYDRNRNSWNWVCVKIKKNN